MTTTTEVNPSSRDTRESSPLIGEFGARLVMLCDGRAGLRSGLPTEIRESSPTSPETGNSAAVLDFIASSEALDRSEEIISAAGWRLENYRRNPVFQNAHQYGDVIFTLGRALITEVRSDASTPNAPRSTVLFQRIEFAVDANPMARIAYALYKGRFLNAVSVGFIPIRWENGGPEAGYRRRYLEQELLEVSAVGIPANPEALRLGVKAGAIAKNDLRAVLEVLREGEEEKPEARGQRAEGRRQRIEIEFCSHTAGAATDTSALGGGANGAQWLRLARAIRDVMRDG